MRVAFLHGLESRTGSKKEKYLDANADFVYAPSLDYKDPALFQKTLTKIQSLNIDLIVGSSMGGWFAYTISTLTGIPTILLNPALQGRAFDPDGVKLGTRGAKHLVVLGKADKVIDPNKTKAWIKENGIGSFDITMESIGHRSPVFVLSNQYSKLNETKTFKTLNEFIEMKSITTYDDFLNESKNSKDSYPLKNEKEAQNMLSGRTADSWRSKSMEMDLIDVFGEEQSILSGDVVDMYLQNNSTDDGYIFRIKRSDLRQTRYFYIPSNYRGKDQYDKIYKTW